MTGIISGFNQGKNGKLTSKQCQVLYPVQEERSIYYKLENEFGPRANAELILSLCDYDFELAQSIAEQAVSLFHGNVKLIEELYERFSGDLRKGISYLSDFKRNFPQDSTTSHCRAALGILTAFVRDFEIGRICHHKLFQPPVSADREAAHFDDSIFR